MSLPSGKTSVASIKFGIILLAFTIASLGFLAFYIYYYFSTFLGQDYQEIREYMLFRKSILQLLPFILMIIVFIMALWVYTVYVDLNNFFKEFDRSPTNAMFNVLLPVINLYGIGMSFTRIVNFIDTEPDMEEYEQNSYGLKMGLIVLYSGIAGVIAVMILGFNFPDTIDQFQKRGMLVFHGISFLMIILTAAGLITMINYMNKIIKLRTATLSILL